MKIRKVETVSQQENILIVDTGADQTTIGGDAWSVLDKISKQIRCNGWMVGNIGNGPLLSIVSAVTCVKQDDDEPFLLVVH